MIPGNPLNGTVINNVSEPLAEMKIIRPRLDENEISLICLALKAYHKQLEEKGAYTTADRVYQLWDRFMRLLSPRSFALRRPRRSRRRGI